MGQDRSTVSLVQKDIKVLLKIQKEWLTFPITIDSKMTILSKCQTKSVRLIMADIREEIVNIKPVDPPIFNGKDDRVLVHMHRHLLIRRNASNYGCPCILSKLFGIVKEDDRQLWTCNACKYNICSFCIDIALKQERSVKWFIKSKIPEFSEIIETTTDSN